MYSYYVPSIVPFYQCLYFGVRIGYDVILFSNFGMDKVLGTPHYAKHTQQKPFTMLAVRITFPNANTNRPLSRDNLFQSQSVTDHYLDQYPISNPLEGWIKKHKIELKKAKDVLFYQEFAEKQFIENIKPIQDLTDDEFLQQLEK